MPSLISRRITGSQWEAYIGKWVLADHYCQQVCDCEWLTFRNWLRPICVSPDQRWQQCLLIRQSCARHCIGQFTLLTAAYYLRQRDSIEAGSVLVLSKPAFAYQRIGGTMRRQASPLTAKTSSSFAQSLCERACSVRSRSVCVVGIFADQRHSLLDSCSICTLLTARALADQTLPNIWDFLAKHYQTSQIILTKHYVAHVTGN